MANLNALSSVIRALLVELRADLWCFGAAIYPPNFLIFN